MPRVTSNFEFYSSSFCSAQNVSWLLRNPYESVLLDTCFQVCVRRYLQFKLLSSAKAVAALEDARACSSHEKNFYWVFRLKFLDLFFSNFYVRYYPEIWTKLLLHVTSNCKKLRSKCETYIPTPFWTFPQSFYFYMLLDSQKV